MKSKIVVAAVIGVGLQMFPGNRAMAQEQVIDTFFDGAPKSQGSFRQDDSRHHDDDRQYDVRGRDDGRRYSRDDRKTSDPDVVVRRAYEDILNREPDQEGLRLYRSKMLDENWSEQDVRNDLRKSAERAGRTPGLADVAIRRAYQDILGREPDQAGLVMYRKKIVDEGWSERDVRSDLKKSSERRMTSGISTGQAQQMVRRAYRSVLGREPDSGSTVYIQKIMQNHWSEDDVANKLRNSAEYRNKHSKK